VREMMLGTRDKFQYNQCSKCKSLQIESIPQDLGEYYPRGKYYSFTKQDLLFGDHIYKISFYHTPILYKILSYFFFTDLNLDAISRINLSKGSRILDVGSGSGSTLLKLKSFGYQNISGIDPYIDKDVLEPVKILRKTLTELSSKDKYDLVMFLHSFEHVSDPLETLMSARELLDTRGAILIRTPIVSYAFEKYGEFWYGIDAPRHLFILSECGLNFILKRADLEIVDSYYDSTHAQFVFSEGYKNNISMNEVKTRSNLSKLMARLFSSNIMRANNLNFHRRGDQAVFYIRKKDKYSN
jgi:SAM-dependent methyltransferase